MVGLPHYFILSLLSPYDLDVFIILAEADEKNLILPSPIFDYLKFKGYPCKGEHIIIEGVPVQFIPADELEEEAMWNAKVIEYEGIKLYLNI